MQTSTPATQAYRPAFELEPYEDEALPREKRLLRPDELTGHTIKCTVECPTGKKGDQVDLVIVTETLCWLTVGAHMHGSCPEDGTFLSYDGERYHSQSENLAEYLSAKEMFDNGLVSKGQFDALLKLEAEQAAAEKAQKAAELRKELAQLEGGAA